MNDYGDGMQLSTIASIRKRPGMYLGGTDFFGYIQYIVSAFDLLLDHDATWIELDIGKNLHIASDANIQVYINAENQLQPFEAFESLGTNQDVIDGAILTALSDYLNVVISDGSSETRLQYKAGERQIFEQHSAIGSEPGIKMHFAPDPAVFSVTNASPTVLQSYCSRTVCLHPGVAVRIKLGDNIIQYYSEKGIEDLFTAIATPYQILHQPINISESKGELKVQAVFAFHSWSENHIWSYANCGRVPDGGTHEAGMLNAISQFHSNLQNSHPVGVGILAVLAIEYPDVTYKGCIKSRIGNPELVDLVDELISRGIERWIANHSEEAEHLRRIERFQFALFW